MRRYSKTLFAALAAIGMSLSGTGCNKPAVAPAVTEQPAATVPVNTTADATNAPVEKVKPASEHPTGEHPHS